jgi:hypothetical protein
VVRRAGQRGFFGPVFGPIRGSAVRAARQKFAVQAGLATADGSIGRTNGTPFRSAVVRAATSGRRRRSLLARRGSRRRVPLHAEAGAAACLHGAVVPGLALAHLRGWAPCSRRTAGSPALTTPAPTARGPGGRVWQHEARTEGRY